MATYCVRQTRRAMSLYSKDAKYRIQFATVINGKQYRDAKVSYQVKLDFLFVFHTSPSSASAIYHTYL